jgi:hypothetical protein
MKIRTTVAALLCATALLSGPAAMASEPTPQPGPNDLTWSQLAKLRDSSTASNSSSLPLSTRSIQPSCTIDTGYIYFRTSGAIYDYGAVGLKPTVKCTATMPFLVLTTNLYKRVWYGLQFQVGPVVTTGSLVTQVQTKSIEKKCLSRSASNTFVAIVTADMIFGTYPPGTVSAYQENTLNCVTN